MPLHGFEHLDGAFSVKVVALFPLMQIDYPRHSIKTRGRHAIRQHDAAILGRASPAYLRDDAAIYR
jgi:hypothetical protein